MFSYKNLNNVTINWDQQIELDIDKNIHEDYDDCWIYDNDLDDDFTCSLCYLKLIFHLNVDILHRNKL